MEQMIWKWCRGSNFFPCPSESVFFLGAYGAQDYVISAWHFVYSVWMQMRRARHVFWAPICNDTIIASCLPIGKIVEGLLPGRWESEKSPRLDRQSVSDIPVSDCTNSSRQNLARNLHQVSWKFWPPHDKNGTKLDPGQWRRSIAEQ